MNDNQPQQQLHSLRRDGQQQSVEEDYLDYLLNPTEDSVDSEPAKVQQPPIESTVPETELEAATPTPKTSPQMVETSHDSTNDIPFACQLFILAGLKLAIPLSNFTQVLDRPEKLLPPDKHQKWLLGQMPYGEKLLNIVDLPGLIFDRPKDSDISNYSSMILLQDAKTCLPCEQVTDMITVNPDKVCWRNADSHRIWLAGTIKQDGYMLLNIDGIIQLSEIP